MDTNNVLSGIVTPSFNVSNVNEASRNNGGVGSAPAPSVAHQAMQAVAMVLSKGNESRPRVSSGRPSHIYLSRPLRKPPSTNSNSGSTGASAALVRAAAAAPTDSSRSRRSSGTDPDIRAKRAAPLKDLQVEFVNGQMRTSLRHNAVSATGAPPVSAGIGSNQNSGTSIPASRGTSSVGSSAATAATASAARDNSSQLLRAEIL